MLPVEQQRIARIIGVPMDLGQQRRGVDMGPSAVRYAGLQERLARLGYTVQDGGNITVPVVEAISEAEASQAANARHLNAVVAVCQAVYEQMTCCVADHEFAI